MALKKFLILTLLASMGTAPLSAESLMLDTPTSAPRKKRKKLISFNFDNEDMVTIINYLAAEKKMNVILPPAPNTLNTKVTLHHQKKLSVDEAFKMLNTLLDMAGYIMLPHGNTFIISRVTGNTVRETLPIYIGVPPEILPNSDEPIRYLYYFDNIKIPAGATGQAQDIKTILEDVLQDPNKPGSTQIIFDSVTNCVIITAKSYSIKTAMQIIEELDKTGFRESIEVIPITNSTATFVGKFLTEQLLAPMQGGSPLAAPGFDSSYFAKTTKVIPDARTNSLIILGRTQAVAKLKDFIYEYIDVPLESGESLIHVYELQYLEAQKFADDLRNMIKPAEVAGQAKGSTAETRAFQGVIIEAEKPGETNKLQTQAAGGDVGVAVQGGNRLIIAAKKSDWVSLKQLIESLDKPQPQIALEILIADINLKDSKKLGSQIRNRGDALPKDVNFQFAGLSTPVVFDTSLQSNLLGFPPPPATGTSNVATVQPSSSFVLSFNDPTTNGIWWIAEVLKRFESTKILSHPHIITLNQVQAKVSISENRLADGPVNRNPDGSISRLNVNLDASLSVEILPRINLSNSINLQIAVKINNFVNTQSDARNTRTIVTNATIGNGEVLVLGGLVKTTEADVSSEVPILGKIPLIGWLFKSRSKAIGKDELMVFICPTVIKPKLGGGMTSTSAHKFAAGKTAVEKSEIFEKVKDPITHWFFRSPKDSAKGMVNHYEQSDFFGVAPLKGGESDAALKEQNVAAVNEVKARRDALKRPSRRKKNTPIEENTTVSEHDESQKLKALLAQESNPLKARSAA